MADIAYTQNHQILIPDIEITVDRPEYVYVPLRGSSYSMAVFMANPATGIDHPVGWIKSTTLGYDTVNEWMIATKWQDQGY